MPRFSDREESSEESDDEAMKRQRSHAHESEEEHISGRGCGSKAKCSTNNERSSYKISAKRDGLSRA